MPFQEKNFENHDFAEFWELTVNMIFEALNWQCQENHSQSEFPDIPHSHKPPGIRPTCDLMIGIFKN